MNAPSTPVSRNIIATVAFSCVAVVWTDQFTSFDHAKLLAAPVFVCILMTGLLVHPPKRFALPPMLLWLALAIACVGVIHVLGAGRSSSATVIASVARLWILLALVACLVSDTEGKSRVVRVRWLILGATLPVMVLAWIQYFSLAPNWFPQVPGYDQSVYSVFGNQNLLGGFIALGVPVSLYILVHSKRLNPWVLVYLALACATLLLTGSRTAWLAAIVGASVTIPRRHPKHAAVIGLSVVIGVAFVMMLTIPEATVERIRQSFSTADEGWHVRLWIWTGAMNLAQSNGVFGLGPGGFAMASPAALGEVLQRPGGELYHSNTLHTWYAHSTPLDLLLDWGLVGGIILVGWFAILVRNRESALFGGGMTFLVYSLFNSVAPSTPHVVAGLLILVALTQPAGESATIASTRPRIAAGLVGIVALSIVIGVVHLRPDYQLARARASFDALGNTPESRAVYAQAAANPFAPPQTHLEYGILMLTDASAEALDAYLTAADGLDTGEVHLLLSYAYEAEQRADEALAHAREATYRWPRHVSAWEQRLALEENAYAVWTFEARRWLDREEWGSLGRRLELSDRQDAP